MTQCASRRDVSAQLVGFFEGRKEAGLGQFSFPEIEASNVRGPRNDSARRLFLARMRFDLSNRVTHPAPLVLSTMIDRMEEIVPFLANVDSIETCERRELAEGRIRIVRRWQGAASAAPVALRPFLSHDLLAWIDTAVWTPAEYKVAWTHSTAMTAVAAFYECSGVNFFEPYPAAPATSTRVRITGELKVRAENFPGIPAFLGSRLAPQVERFLIGLLTPNLESLAHGLQGYLDRRQSR
jgi:hypothetical protein